MSASEVDVAAITARAEGFRSLAHRRQQFTPDKNVLTLTADVSNLLETLADRERVITAVREYVDTLADDLAKAEAKHFSIALMRVRVKSLRALLTATGAETDT